MSTSRGCPDCQRTEQARLSRRGFLRGAGGLAAAGYAGLATQTLGTRLAFAEGLPTMAASTTGTAAVTTPYSGDVLVVLSLRGGFDGLSAIVPAGDPDYYTARPSIAVPQATLLPLDTMFGLHPALQPLLPFWTAGTFGAVVAAGQPDPTRSHFEATEEMERAAPSSSLRTGWLDRALGLRGSGTVFQAAQLGDASPGQQFAGPAPELSLGSIDDFSLSAVGGDTAAEVSREAKRWGNALHSFYSGSLAPLAAPALAALGALNSTRAMQSAGYTPANGASYDASSELATALKDVARLIKSGVGLQVAAVDYGDWDMHSGLGTVDTGWMHRKLTELGNALAAFVTDLGAAMSRVTVVTISEFGRRVEENDSAGVDHGHGNTMLLLGGGINGGKIHGSWPGLAPAALDDGDVAGTTDYRVVLAELLSKRCGQTNLDQVFPGLPSGELGVARTS